MPVKCHNPDLPINGPANVPIITNAAAAAAAYLLQSFRVILHIL